MNTFSLKRFAALLPLPWQQEIKRFHYHLQIRRQHFQTTEPEYHKLNSLVSADDYVIDVGANVGHYTKKLSDLVGTRGRVIAIEPVIDTFSILAANVLLFQFTNVTLLNVAASDRINLADFQIPTYDNGLKNYYLASIATNQTANSPLATNLSVMTMPLDCLQIHHPIQLVKIDTEGHELSVLRGMKQLLKRDHPILIVETEAADVIAYLADFGYTYERLGNSPNIVFQAVAP